MDKKITASFQQGQILWTFISPNNIEGVILKKSNVLRHQILKPYECRYPFIKLLKIQCCAFNRILTHEFTISEEHKYNLMILE